MLYCCGLLILGARIDCSGVDDDILKEGWLLKEPGGVSNKAVVSSFFRAAIPQARRCFRVCRKTALSFPAK